jgi:hypothetical protein
MLLRGIDGVLISAMSQHGQQDLLSPDSLTIRWATELMMQTFSRLPLKRILFT